MENIILQPVQQEYIDFMSLPMGVAKNIQYYNVIQGRQFWESNLCKKDGCVYYSHSVFIVKKSKNGYYKQNKTRDGFTLNEKGKLSIWFGKSIFQVPGVRDVFNHFNLNWFNDRLQLYVTKTIAEKMLTGKITNNLDVVKAYMKAMKLNCSARLLYNVMTDNTYNKPYLLSLLSVAKDQNHLLEMCLNVENKNLQFHLGDMMKQAQILDRKIDFKWSDKRMREEHQNWTKEIMDIEFQTIEDVTAEHLLPFLEFNRPGFKLLTTKKEIYTEGKIMNHCVYTNYWSSVERKHYIVYHLEFFGETATLGCYIGDNITLNQCYGYANKPISSDLSAYVNNFIMDLNTWVKEKQLLKQTEFVELPY